ncbi:hypothetical protein HDV03_001920 [Kappamyces sp. JEL0829]|nr:hypothetical protein HDV03_001920 [Kappamyces sp. JEL0829]
MNLLWIIGLLSSLAWGDGQSKDPRAAAYQSEYPSNYKQKFKDDYRTPEQKERFLVSSFADEMPEEGFDMELLFGDGLQEEDFDEHLDDTYQSWTQDDLDESAEFDSDEMDFQPMDLPVFSKEFQSTYFSD